MKTRDSSMDIFLRDDYIVTFEEAVRHLCQVWFEGKECDRYSIKLENFVLTSGTYGLREHFFLVNQRKQGGKVRYLLSRIILPYEKMKYRYPSVRKWPILMPVYVIVRVVQFLFGQKRRLLQEYIDVTKNDFDEKSESIASIMDYVGL